MGFHGVTGAGIARGRKTPRPRRYRGIAFALIIALLGTSFGLYYRWAARHKGVLQSRYDEYVAVMTGEQQWLAGLRLSNGALAFRPAQDGKVSINPYFSSISLIGLLQQPTQEHLDAARDYFEWYFANINNEQTDKSAVAGTIYDHEAQVDGLRVLEQKSLGVYDSTDAYAALFFIAQWEYYSRGGDRAYLQTRYEQTKTILGALRSTLDGDGLSYAKAEYPIKYLMDNAEVYAALGCAARLYEQVYLPGLGRDGGEYEQARETARQLKEEQKALADGVERLLWNDGQQCYEVGLDNGGNVLAFSDWSEFYPDAVVQLFPILFGVIAPESDRAQSLYARFNEAFSWETLEHYTGGQASFYWGLTAYCGALMGDEARVRTYLEHYLEQVTPDHDYPAYNADAAWVVMACSRMAQQYARQIKRIDPLGIVKADQGG